MSGSQQAELSKKQQLQRCSDVLAQPHEHTVEPNWHCVSKPGQHPCSYARIGQSQEKEASTMTQEFKEADFPARPSSASLRMRICHQEQPRWKHSHTMDTPLEHTAGYAQQHQIPPANINQIMHFLASSFKRQGKTLRTWSILHGPSSKQTHISSQHTNLSFWHKMDMSGFPPLPPSQK